MIAVSKAIISDDQIKPLRAIVADQVLSKHIWQHKSFDLLYNLHQLISLWNMDTSPNPPMISAMHGLSRYENVAAISWTNEYAANIPTTL